MPTALAFSPHLDDAVFSAGGTLARLAHEGWRVVIATVFTASVPDPRGFALACQLDKGLSREVDYMALRRAEDAAACAAIGAEPIWMPFPEAPHRGYGSADALFGDRHVEDHVAEEIAPEILRLVDRMRPELVFGPQAVGAHVDHVAVHFALRELAIPAAFWLDFPYAIRPFHKDPFGSELAEQRRITAQISDDDLARKCRAVMAYTSQLGFQFGGRAEAERIIAGDGSRERFAAADAVALSFLL